MRASTALAVAVAVVAGLGIGGAGHASETDDRIESAFKKSYVFKTYLKDEHITISAKDGAVTLAGNVFNESHKPMAEDTAAALPGVRSVDNRIEIKGDRAPENSDNWISMKVKSALLYHRNVSGIKTEVSVKDGVVTLKGEAANQAQKALAGEYAKDIVGVKDVKNEMTVSANPDKPRETAGEKIDDASITAQVKATLLSHRATGAIRTKVATQDGVVTLTGQARNAAEKSLVSKLVADINGVKSVVNNMTIE